MTETLSLISVVVMALLLWREHRAHVATKASRDTIHNTLKRVEQDFQALWSEHLRWSDRDEKGRFVKREKGRAV